MEALSVKEIAQAAGGIILYPDYLSRDQFKKYG